MAFAIQDTLAVIHGHLAASGYIPGGVQVGEPKQPVEGIYAAIYMSSVAVTRLYLNGGTEELHTVNVRLYEDMLKEPQDTIEYGVAKVVSEITSVLFGDFAFGGNIKNLDIGGINGTPVSAVWGYIDLGGRMYRVVDLVLPLVVDDSATAAP